MKTKLAHCTHDSHYVGPFNLLMGLVLAGGLFLFVRELPALLREIRIMRM